MKQHKEVAAGAERVGKATGPLSWEQLSDNELATIIEIERRLYEVRAAVEPRQSSKKLTDSLKNEDLPPLADVKQLYERVLLIDGGRGTGKSSLLQTLIERWIDEKKRTELLDNEEYKKRVESLNVSNFVSDTHDTQIPAFAKVFYLDFDPLPHKMPLMAGIVQAWKSLAKHYDKSSGHSEECDDEDLTLEDRWHALFRVAAFGWSDTPHEGGLIEQVLNREDQVQNWHYLSEEWKRFVDELIKAGRCVKDSKYGLAETPVFVIAIDDVDLQVERMRELLPALQNLYHPNVLFIVAADKAHMMDMLQLSFYGQQRRLENVQLTDKSTEPSTADIWPDRKEMWPGVLAQESIRKVFPLRNTWKLHKLSLRELLRFPKDSEKTFKTYFESWRQQDPKKSGDFGHLATYLDEMAGKPEDTVQLPPIISYRAADQIFDRVSAYSSDANMKIGALIAIRDILAQSGEDLVKIASQTKANDKQSITTEEVTDTEIRSSVTNTGDENKKNDIRFAANIIYKDISNLQAIFPDVFVHDTGNDSEIVLSGYPDFRYRHGRSGRLLHSESAEFVTALIAGSLRDDGYGVLAPGLQWNVPTAIAWTSARVLELGLYLTLRWQLHMHPSPLRLYRWANQWSEFIETLSTETQNLEARIAYAWIYYQLTWLGTDVKTLKPGLPAPTIADLDPKEYWDELLQLNPTHGSDKEIPRWKRRTLPLMARPELWLPPDLQERLLTPHGGIDQRWLRYQRERLITDGIIASQDLGMPAPKNPEEQQLARRAAKIFDARHSETHDGKKSPWEVHVYGGHNKENDLHQEGSET